MNEQQAQVLAQCMRAHLPHVKVEVQKRCDLQEWIDAAYPRDPKFPRPAHDDDGTWACRVVLPDEDVTRASTRIARIFFDEMDWNSYVSTYEPLIHRVLNRLPTTHQLPRTSHVAAPSEPFLRVQEPSPELLLALLQRDTVPALTLTEPWCSLLAEQKKRIETRSWHTSYRGPVALHAASTLPRDLDALCHQGYFYEALALRHYRGGRWTFPVKHVLAIGMLEEVLPTETVQVSEQERAFGNYRVGRYAWRFSALYRLKTPILARGSLSLWQWTPSESFWHEIQAQYDTALATNGKAEVQP